MLDIIIAWPILISVIIICVVISFESKIMYSNEVIVCLLYGLLHDSFESIFYDGVINNTYIYTMK